MNSVVFNWGLFPLDAPIPDDNKLLTESKLASSSSFILEGFTRKDLGKRVWVAGRWENHKGQRGPFSEMQEFVIS
jgi:hypothetical protein